MACAERFPMYKVDDGSVQQKRQYKIQLPLLDELPCFAENFCFATIDDGIVHQKRDQDNHWHAFVSCVC